MMSAAAENAYLDVKPAVRDAVGAAGAGGSYPVNETSTTSPCHPHHRVPVGVDGRRHRIPHRANSDLL